MLYEMRTLRRANVILSVREAARLQGHVSDSLWETFESAMLESWALHARNLIDFLYPPSNRKPDDAVADDFFEQAEWDRLRPEMDEALSRLSSELIDSYNPGGFSIFGAD